MKLKREYFKPGCYHVCMFCETPIAKLKDGKLRSIASKAHVLMTKTFPGIYTINCCQDCAKHVDFKNPRTITEIHHNVIYEQEFLDRCSGETHAEINSKRKLRLLDRPTTEFHISELDPAQRDKHIREHQDFKRKKV